MAAGKALEVIVKSAVEDLIKTGVLGLNQECCRVFLNRGYYSRDRGREIIVDVSIELIPRGTSAPSLLWIWECKEYAGAVSVDHVEEFHAKLEQIGADLTKGTFVTTGYYQKSAIEYAVSKGIGLTRLLDGNTIRIEERPGLYLPATPYSVCFQALMAPTIPWWNSYTHWLPRAAPAYVMSLQFGADDDCDTAFYGVKLATAIVKQLNLIRDRVDWLTFPADAAGWRAIDSSLFRQ